EAASVMCRRIWLALVWRTVHPLESFDVRIQRIGITPLLEKNEVPGLISLPVEGVIDAAVILGSRARHGFCEGLGGLRLVSRLDPQMEKIGQHAGSLGAIRGRLMTATSNLHREHRR